MKMKVIAALIWLLGVTCAFPQASPYSIFMFDSQTFTATGQTGAAIQLNGLVVPSTVGSSFASGNITVTGNSLTSVTFGVLGSADNGKTYFPLIVRPIANPGATGTTVTVTGGGIFQISLGALTHVKFVTSGTFNATSATLLLSASPNAALNNPAGGSPYVLTKDAVTGLGMLSNSTTGTASALSGTPVPCDTGQAAGGVASNGNAINCFTPAGGSISGTQYVLPMYGLTGVGNSPLKAQTPNGNPGVVVNGPSFILDTTANGYNNLSFNGTDADNDRVGFVGSPGDPNFYLDAVGSHIFRVNDATGMDINALTIGHSGGIVAALPTTVNIAGFNPGYDHENTGFTAPSFTINQDDYFNGFKSFLHIGAIHRAIYGDNNGLDLASSDRSGVFMPSDEGDNEVIRFEHQELMPYQALYNGNSGTDAAGHTIYAMNPEYNQADLGGDAPLIDLTTGQADTADTATNNDGPRTIHTTGAAHGVSVTGTLTSDAIPDLNASVNTPTLVTFNIAYSGPNPAGSDAVISTYAGEPNIGGNNHEQIPEKVHIISATAINGGYTVSAELNHPHYTGDHIPIGGTVGSYIEWTAHSVGYYWQYRTVEMVLESPTGNTEVVGHPSEGVADSYAETGPIMRYQGVQVIDPNGSTVGGLITVARSNFVPAQADVLQQPNAMAAAYTLYRNNERILNHYASWQGFIINQQDSQLMGVDGHGNPNPVFDFALDPTIPTFYYENQTGPFLTLKNQPTASLVGGNCIGHSYLGCIGDITGDTSIFYGQFDKGGFIEMSIAYDTGRWKFSDADFGGTISTLQNAQYEGEGEYGIALNGTGVPPILATAAMYGGTLLQRCGFATAGSLASVPSGGFLSQWHVNAALNSQVNNAGFCQMEGSKMVWIGNDGDTQLAGSLDPNTHTFAAAGFAPYPDTPTASSDCHGHAPNAIWADDSYAYHCNAAGTTSSRVAFSSF